MADNPDRSTLSTHVLDTGLGIPARGIRVRLDRATTGAREPGPLGEGTTDDDGRVASIGPDRLDAGDYRLTFATSDYFAAGGRDGFFPEVVIAFTIADPQQHYHVPVLLSPFGYTTYRGS